MTTILSKNFHDKVPVVVNDESGSILKTNKSKFLLEKDMTLGQFMCMIRKKNQLTPHEAIYVFCNNVLPKSNTTVLDLWNEHKNKEDDILYMSCSKENTFG